MIGLAAGVFYAPAADLNGLGSDEVLALSRVTHGAAVHDLEARPYRAGRTAEPDGHRERNAVHVHRGLADRFASRQAIGHTPSVDDCVRAANESRNVGHAASPQVVFVDAAVESVCAGFAESEAFTSCWQQIRKMSAVQQQPNAVVIFAKRKNGLKLYGVKTRSRANRRCCAEVGRNHQRRHFGVNAFSQHFRIGRNKSGELQAEVGFGAGHMEALGLFCDSDSDRSENGIARLVVRGVLLLAACA